MMKKTALALLISLFATLPAMAHYLWIETEGTGQAGLEHEVRVYFGEYTYGVIEQVEGEAFPAVARFTLWLIDPDGTRTRLNTSPGKEYYEARFNPDKEGVYTLALDNNDIEVIDYTQYDFGIFKTHYHATARVIVGGGNSDTQTANPEGIALNQLGSADGEVQLQVLYKGEPLADQELKVYVADLWSKTLETDKEGMVSFKLPWDTKYLVETTRKEEVPGTFKGKDYDFIWHCATFYLKK